MEEAKTSAAGEYDKSEGCAVEWAWLAGRRLMRINSDLQTITFEFEDGQTFKVQANLYKGEPFLSFTPYKDPRPGA